MFLFRFTKDFKCKGLSYLFLYAMEQSKDKVDVDNINYFERMLQLIMDTDFEAIKTKIAQS